MSSHGTFGTAINCIDGRTQSAVSEWVKNNGHVDYVDMVTEAGCDKVMCDAASGLDIKRKVMISVNAHHSSIIVVAGHHDCAGHPVSKEEHLKDILLSMETVKSWEGVPARVVGLWVNEEWQIEVVADSAAQTSPEMGDTSPELTTAA